MLTAHAGDHVAMFATVLLPPGPVSGEKLPFAYHVHGFGGSHRSGKRRWGADTLARHENGEAPRIVHVFLDANHAMGHHAFADSPNTGPWGAALTEELIPAIESRFAGEPVSPGSRFVSGHSSGGWSSLWLQVEYPHVFGGVWSTAPDPVDFHDFTGTDLYRDKSVYRDENGEPRQLVRRDGRWTTSFEAFARKEAAEKPVGGQMYSFDAVFSPRGPLGPKPMFDRSTGAIDPTVVEHWRAYDIADKLEREWSEIGPSLEGKIHVFVGTQDTFRLEGATRLLAKRLAQLGSDATIEFADGRTHFDLYDPEPTLYPEGLRVRVEREMWAAHERARSSTP
jgi:S-formylglutathione hydrolase FrmB